MANRAGQRVVIAYHRFIPRETDRDATQAAKAAKPAEVEAGSRARSANALLRLANRGGFSTSLAELPQPEVAEIRHFSGCSRFRSGHVGTRRELDEANAAIPRGWIDGLKSLACMGCPPGYPPAAWERALADAEEFMARWAAQAATLGWGDFEVWGVHRRAPWRRLEGRGLVPVLQGSKIGALTTTEALIVKPNGVRLTFRRRARDPLHPSERALLWQLG
jgi:hypothetical protein